MVHCGTLSSSLSRRDTTPQERYAESTFASSGNGQAAKNEIISINGMKGGEI